MVLPVALNRLRPSTRSYGLIEFGFTRALEQRVGSLRRRGSFVDDTVNLFTNGHFNTDGARLADDDLGGAEPFDLLADFRPRLLDAQSARQT